MRMGLAISRSGVRAVAVCRGRKVWVAERMLDDVAHLRTALAELAGERPRAARRVRVVIEHDLCEVKVLRNLPPVSLAKLREIVALQASRWFLANGTDPATMVAPLGRGQGAVAAATDPALLRAVADGCRDAGLRLIGVTPAAVAFAATLPDGAHERIVGDRRETIHVSKRKVTALRRSVARMRDASAGDDADRAPMLAATVRGVPGFPIPRRLDGPSKGGKAALVRVAVLALLFWIAAGVVFLWRTGSAVRSAAAEMSILEPGLDRALAVQRDLHRAEQALATLADAVAHASVDTDLLALLTAAFPDSAYLVSVRRSAAGIVTLAGVAPSASRVVAQLDTLPGVHNAALRGPVTREASGAAIRERFAMAFEWRASRPAP